MTSPAAIKYQAAPCTGPCFYRTHLTAPSDAGALRDTYVNTTSISKGMVWVNGHQLGRAWNIGPQGALFLPASWLHGGANEVDAFELNSKGSLNLSTGYHPIFFEPPEPAQ